MLVRVLLGVVLGTSAVVAETVHAVLVFTRHGDRTAKYYPSYQMTNLGSQQLYDSGQFYRQRYIQSGASSKIAGIAPDQVNFRQLWASAPDQGVLFQTATNFLQGLYPPLGSLNPQLGTETLANGTNITDPLNGYQFILVNGEGDTDSDTIWIKGDDFCPAYDTASRSYRNSTQYQTTFDRTKDFYSKFTDILGPIMGAANVTYRNAYDVFDLMNVASIHNSSVAPRINASDLAQLHALANEWEWNHNFNATQPDRSIGGMALGGRILQRLQAALASSTARNKFQLMAGSYDTFLSFFGLTNLTAASENFYGIPDYASSFAFELFTTSGTAENPASFPSLSTLQQDLQMRFLFRNGTDPTDTLTAFPLFGTNEVSMPYFRFYELLAGRSIHSLNQWCTRCGSLEAFCVAANNTSPNSAASGSNQSSRDGLSPAAAGGIGAGVTLAVVALVAGLTWLMMRRKKAPSHAQKLEEKRASDSSSENV